MNIFEIINKSQNQRPLLKEEIFWLVDQFTQDKIPDYQMSAWLATVFINHLSDEETAWLTEALCLSGEKLTWTEPTIDKHSTGGVGDKTSLIIAPLVSSLGYKVPMMAGRGLGHTGGTIDKLESIGFKTSLDVNDFKTFVHTIGTCIMGQSENFCPADKRLYALRDATHTVANIPLICSSIMSKKIAEGLRGLVLDIKFGSGAFMPTFEKSKMLAQKLISIGQKNNIITFGVLSSMEQPLGRYIGNKLEVFECLEILKDPEQCFEKYEDNILLSLLLSALMIYALKPESPLEKHFEDVYNQLMSGKAYDKFVEMIETQGGGLTAFFSKTASTEENIISWGSDFKYAPKAKKYTLLSNEDGFMNYKDVKALGFAAVSLGAGRFTKEDQIDFEVGFYCHKKQSDRVKKSEALFDIYYNDDIKLKNTLLKLNIAFEIAKDTKTISNSPIVKNILSYDGTSYSEIHFKNKFLEV